MPKYRQLHTKILDSDDFNEMPDDFTRLVWVLLPLILDSEGRGLDSMAWVKSKLFPKRVDEIATRLVYDAMNWLVGRGMVRRYAVNGKAYFYLPTFKDYQSRTEREAKSILPDPPPTPELVGNRSGVDQELRAVTVSVSVSASESESESVIVSESDSAPEAQKRPEIFTLYEQEMGALTPMIAQALVEDEQLYPREWIAMAFQESAGNNKRSLKYAEAILKRWKVEGFNSRHANGKSPPGNGKVSAYEKSRSILQDALVRAETEEVENGKQS